MTLRESGLLTLQLVPSFAQIIHYRIPGTTATTEAEIIHFCQKNSERSEVSDLCTELTTITPEMIREEGISFKEAYSIIKKEYEGQSRAWASFGAYDLKHIQRQCSDLGVGYPLGPSHINVKTLFALKNKLETKKEWMVHYSIFGSNWKEHTTGE